MRRNPSGNRRKKNYQTYLINKINKSMKKANQMKRHLKVSTGRKFYTCILLTGAFQFWAKVSLAQADGNAGISEATGLIKGYFSTGVNLMYAIGAVVGLIGAIKVYNKWSAGEPDTTKVASSWFGACIFLVVVATVIKSFFSV
jgi:hypothetical protein